MSDQKNQTIILTTNEQLTDETAEELTLRPQKFNRFVGQDKIKQNLLILIQAAKERNQSIDHILFHGPPGLGKTSLAHIVANEIGANLKVTSGPAIEKAGDLATILTNLKQGDVLFVDEIHKFNRTIEEILYPAMEDFVLDLILGKGPTAKTLRLELAKFTLIGATTQVGKISSPLRDRFGAQFHLDFYEIEDIETIIQNNSSIFNLDIETAARTIIAKSSRRTPRIANRLLKRVRDFSQVKKIKTIDIDTVSSTLRLLEIDHLGLDKVDRQLLSIIEEKFAGGPVGLSTLSAASGESADTIEEVYEPFLIREGLIKRTPRGREITAKGKSHIKQDFF